MRTKCLLINGRTVSQPKDNAGYFNDYFTSTSKVHQIHIPLTKRNFSDHCKNLNTEPLFMTPTSPEEISDSIQTLSSNKSTGPNSIPPSILNKIKNEIYVPLSAIINNSFENSSFPNLLKSAKVIPVFKIGFILSCNNYKPILHLPNTGKINEISSKKRLNHFLEQRKTFYALQFGFNLNISTFIGLRKVFET